MISLSFWVSFTYCACSGYIIFLGLALLENLSTIFLIMKSYLRSEFMVLFGCTGVILRWVFEGLLIFRDKFCSLEFKESDCRRKDVLILRGFIWPYLLFYRDFLYSLKDWGLAVG